MFPFDINKFLSAKRYAITGKLEMCITEIIDFALH